MRWFGGGDKDKKGNDGNGKPASKGRMRIATNAPRHWPPVAVDMWWTENPGLNYLSLAGTLDSVARSTGGTLAFHQERMYDDGIVVIPIMVTEGEQRTAVFAYPRADAAAASHFSGIRGLLRQREGINAVYYAPETIQPATPAKVVASIDTPHFRRTEKERPFADYALWWPTPEDASFANSAALRHLDRWFEALDGFAPYLFTSFIREMMDADGVEGSKGGVRALPEQPLMVAMDAPAGLRAYLHASRANGLWLALDVTTPAAQRDTFLKLLADFATQIRVVVEERKVPPHDRGVVLAWWRAARAEALRKEAAGGVGLRIGQIEETSVRRLDPGPSTAEERGARTTADTSPDPALVDFAGVLMDRARIMASQALASVPDQRLPAPGEPAPPSIPPMLSMRTGADTWTVFFWDDETPESMEAARDLIAEHGPVDMAAFVCDIVLNVGGDRTDALSVRVQGRGDDGSHWFVQRYVPRRRGQSFALSGRWALVRREEPIYPSDTPAASAAVRPSERAIASAHASIADMITFITFEDPSGARKLHRDDDEYEDGKSDNDESRPLLSPRLALEGADADQPARFIVFGLMGAAAGRLSAARAAQDEPDARIAAFRYDHVRLKNGAPHRELRVVVHERGTPQAFLFAQGYKVSKDTAFTTTGEIRLVGPVAPLFAD